MSDKSLFFLLVNALKLDWMFICRQFCSVVCSMFSDVHLQFRNQYCRTSLLVAHSLRRFSLSSAVKERLKHYFLRHVWNPPPGFADIC